MLTAFASAEQRLQGFAVGVDDYVVKPFSPGELVARIESVLRHRPGFTVGLRRIDERLQIDFAEQQVIVAGERSISSGSKRPCCACWWSMRARSYPSTPSDRVWGPAYTDATQYVHLYVNYLRRKIEPNPRAPRYICTKRGVGYRFVVPVAAMPEAAATL